MASKYVRIDPVCERVALSARSLQKSSMSASASRTSLYDEITANIIAEFEADRISHREDTVENDPCSQEIAALHLVDDHLRAALRNRSRPPSVAANSGTSAAACGKAARVYDEVVKPPRPTTNQPAKPSGRVASVQCCKAQEGKGELSAAAVVDAVLATIRGRSSVTGPARRASIFRSDAAPLAIDKRHSQSNDSVIEPLGFAPLSERRRQGGGQSLLGAPACRLFQNVAGFDVRRFSVSTSP
jgi:hypothetical protein